APAPTPSNAPAPSSSSVIPPTPAPTTTASPVPPTPPVPPPSSVAALCASGAVTEVEANDTLATANDLGSATTFCGSIGQLHSAGAYEISDTCTPLSTWQNIAAQACTDGATLDSYTLSETCDDGQGAGHMDFSCVRPDVDHVAFTLPADAQGVSWRASWTQG